MGLALEGALGAVGPHPRHILGTGRHLRRDEPSCRKGWTYRYALSSKTPPKEATIASIVTMPTDEEIVINIVTIALTVPACARARVRTHVRACVRAQVCRPCALPYQGCRLARAE